MPIDWKSEARVLAAIALVFAVAFWMPVGVPRFDDAVHEGLALVHWYAREHVILCLLPAFLIAGAMGVFISQGAVLRHLGADAKRIVAYGVASVSGSVLAVCSCTVLPLFGGLYRRGAGLGPAVAFLYSGPAINVLAIVLTANVLGIELGIARAVGAIVFAVVIGAAMHFIYRREEARLAAERRGLILPDGDGRSPAEAGALFALLIGILVFANWSPSAGEGGVLALIATGRWLVVGALALALALLLVFRFGWSGRAMAALGGLIVAVAIAIPQHPDLPFLLGIIGLAVIAGMGTPESQEWLNQSWGFAKLILPLLLVGVFAAGVLLGRPGHEGLIPAAWVAALVGGNSIEANAFAAVVGSLMYFATLTEVPIVQGLMGAGMGKGPALALLLAGPALSLPNMLVIRSILGTEKTFVYIGLVVVMATISGLVYGTFWP
ncbi:MAG: hypothetical protein EA406_04470 [Rhodospirillales bacterium]|nr:MAG: hypothetical protein EA406_04470 [Rhodospirillales bacterium]